MKTDNSMISPNNFNGFAIISIIICLVFLICPITLFANTNNEGIKTWIQFMAVFVASIAAFFSYLSSRSNRNQLKIKIISDLTRYYDSDAMLKSMRFLREFKNTNKENFIDEYKKQKELNSDTYNNIENARRIATHFYNEVYWIYSANAINNKLLKTIVDFIASSFLLEILWPLEAALNPGISLNMFRFYVKKYNIVNELKYKEQYSQIMEFKGKK